MWETPKGLSKLCARSRVDPERAVAEPVWTSRGAVVAIQSYSDEVVSAGMLLAVGVPSALGPPGVHDWLFRGQHSHLHQRLLPQWRDRDRDCASLGANAAGVRWLDQQPVRQLHIRQDRLFDTDDQRLAQRTLP